MMGALFKAPAQLPALAQLLESFGNPEAAVVAAFLGVTVRTVYGWKRAGQAPRAATLALFYESVWGRSLIECEAVNEARVMRGLSGALERENATLRARIAYLEKTGHFGAANAPTLQPALADDALALQGVNAGVRAF